MSADTVDHGVLVSWGCVGDEILRITTVTTFASWHIYHVFIELYIYIYYIYIIIIYDII